MPNREFSEEEDAQLGTDTDIVIGERIGRNKKQVGRRRRLLSIPSFKKGHTKPLRPLTCDEVDILKAGMTSAREFSEKSGFNVEDTKKLMHKHGSPLVGRSRKKTGGSRKKTGGARGGHTHVTLSSDVTAFLASQKDSKSSFIDRLIRECPEFKKHLEAKGDAE